MNKLMKWILFFFSWTNDFLISVFGLKIVAFSLINSIPFSLNDFLAGMNVISLIIDDLLFGIVDGLFDVLVEMIIEFIFSLIVIEWRSEVNWLTARFVEFKEFKRRDNGL